MNIELRPNVHVLRVFFFFLHLLILQWIESRDRPNMRRVKTRHKFLACVHAICVRLYVNHFLSKDQFLKWNIEAIHVFCFYFYFQEILHPHVPRYNVHSIKVTVCMSL